jgi:ubiquinone/menaquinone biosynthesis C-methylase UbiE
MHKTPKYDKVLSDFRKNQSGRVRRQVKNVLELINLNKDEKILEIGVATGKFTSIISKSNLVFALDLSLDNLRRAKKAAAELGKAENCFYINASASQIPISGHNFDKVLAIDIIEHLNDEVFTSLCRESHRVLKPNGYLYIYTPNLLHPYELARPFRPVLRREHIGVRTRAKICKILKENKFVITKASFNNYFRRISVVAKKV